MSSNLVAEMLEEYGSITRSTLRDYLPDPRPRGSFHDLCAEYPRRGGRALRPTLCIATARAFGRPIEDALCTAASIELMHNAMLIHDDIEDESELRRGLPALHLTVGVPVAINVGDMLAVLSMRPLRDNAKRLGPELALKLLESAERCAMESAEGQAMELAWRHDDLLDLKEADYLRMVLKKTCWMATIYPMQAGALIGTRGRLEPEPIVRFGYLLGAAFQIQDDVLNVIGDPARYGKELGGDLYEGKRTIMLIRLFTSASDAERERLQALLRLPRAERSDAQIRWLRDAMHGYGCVEYARRVAQGLAGAARHEFERAFGSLPDSRDKQLLAALPTWVIERL